MKRLYSSSDPGEIERFKGILDGAGIGYEIRNETIPYPLPIFCPEFWILNDEDFPRACELRDAFAKPAPPGGPLWVCPACGERLEAQFTSCWKCGRGREGAT